MAKGTSGDAASEREQAVGGSRASAPSCGAATLRPMGHELQDRVSLEMGRRVAAGLEKHPEWLELARRNLERWRANNSDAPSLLRCYDTWARLLDRPVGEIVAMLVRDDEEGRQYRQNSPFAGVLSPAEVWAIKRDARETIAG